MQVWLALDPETLRVVASPTEFDDNSFPRGLRGSGWPIRVAETTEEEWQAMLTCQMSNEESNAYHKDLWTQSGETPWPTY